jgi:tetratricopeptide (TPR) repeat protein
MNTVAPSERPLASGVDAQNPWPGLVTFTEELQGFFHGRDEETDELLRRVERRDLTILFGQSGLGKSSLLQAGLFPRLRSAGYLPVSIRLDHAASAPALAEQVKTAVSRAILDAGGQWESPTSDPADTLWEHFHRQGLRQQTRDGQPVRLVLVFDQFEELFAIGHASAESRGRAAQFLTELADLIENRAPATLERRLEESPELVKQFAFHDRGYRALVCFREDYLPHLESLRLSMPSITENRMRLTRMNGARALEAVLIPGGDLVAPEVGRQIIRFVAGGQLRQADATSASDDDDGLAQMEVEPSLLSLVCSELNNRRLALDLPQITADLLAGNRERILQDYYDRCVADQPAVVRAFVEDELVTDSGLRENVALERAQKALTQRGAPASAIDELVKRRLLHLEERLDIQRVELTHDVLTSVVKKSRDERQQKEAMVRAELHAQEIREKAQRQRRRLRVVVGGMAAALLVVGGFGVWSFNLYRTSRERLLEVERQKERAEKQERGAMQARAEAVKEKERAEEGQKLAGQRFDEKRQAMDNMLAEFSDKRLSGQPGTQQIRKVLFERGISFYESMFRENQSDITIQLSLTQRYTELGRLLSEIESLDKSLEQLRKGESILRQLAATDPGNSDYQFRLAELLSNVAYCSSSHNDSEVGIAAAREAIRIVSRLLESNPKNYEYRMCLNKARNRLNRVLTGDERLGLLQQAYDDLRNMLNERPTDIQAMDILARVTVNRGLRQADKNEFKDAERYFLEAKELCKRQLDLNPSAQDAYETQHFVVMGLARVYGNTDRVALGLETLTRMVGDLNALAVANPAVWHHQKALYWTHDDLRKLYQRVGDYNKALISLQEMVRIADGMAQRDPQNSDYPGDMTNAVRGIVYIYRNTKRTDEAIAILDKVIKQADQIMRLHPTSNYLLGDLLQFHEFRGDISLTVQQYDKARTAYEAGVDLYSQFRPTVASLKEFTNYYYLMCCKGLTQIAREQKDTKRAIDIATRLIVPIKPDSFKNSDYKQSLIDELLNLSSLHEDEKHIDESLRMRVLAVEEAKKTLGGDPKSNWYLYKNVIDSHHHLARLYRKLGDDRGEFDSLRDYLTETESYVCERDHTALLAETAAFNPENLKRLREAHDKYFGGGMKRFTVRTDFSGVKFPFHIYVTDSWQSLEDQFVFVEKVRGGKVPKEVVDKFQRLYKIAKENKVSFMDLCVYSLGTVNKDPIDTNESPIVRLKPTGDARTVHVDDALVIARELAAAKAEIQRGIGGPIGKKRLALRYAKLAEDEVAASNLDRATSLSDEASALIDLDATGQPRNPGERDVFAYVQYIQGALLACTGELSKGYAKVIESTQTEPVFVSPEFAIPVGNREFALGWISLKLQRPAESATWYCKAMELGHGSAAARLYQVCQENSQSRRALPEDLHKLFVRATTTAAKADLAPGVFAQLVADAKTQEARAAAQLSQKQRDEQFARLQELAKQFHDLAEVYKPLGKPEEYRNALNKEYNARAQALKIEPTNRAQKDGQAAAAGMLAQSYLDANDEKAAVEWTTRAANLGHGQSHLRLAEWYEKGIHVAVDAKKASHHRYLGHDALGITAFNAKRYEDALTNLLRASQSDEADARAHKNLGMCYGKLNRWEEAVVAYTRSIEMDSKGDRTTGVVCTLMESLVTAERPELLLQFVQAVDKKGWRLPKEGPQLVRYAHIFHGFRAIALLMDGKDATEAERAMRDVTGKPDFKPTGWSWVEMDAWLKATKLAPDRKAAVGKIVAELKGTPSR